MCVKMSRKALLGLVLLFVVSGVAMAWTVFEDKLASVSGTVETASATVTSFTLDLGTFKSGEEKAITEPVDSGATITVSNAVELVLSEVYVTNANNIDAFDKADIMVIVYRDDNSNNYPDDGEIVATVELDPANGVAQVSPNVPLAEGTYKVAYVYDFVAGYPNPADFNGATEITASFDVNLVITTPE